MTEQEEFEFRLRYEQEMPGKGKPKESKPAVDIAGGILRGAGSIGATILAPIDWAARQAGIENSWVGRQDRREAMDAGLRTAGVNTDSLPFKGAKLGTEISGTLGVGGTLGAGLKGVPMLAKYAPVVESGGFTLANAATGSKLVNAGIRAAGGAVTGGASAGLIDPESVGMGAAIGGALPGAIQAAGMAGKLIKRATGTGEAYKAKLLQDALGVTPSEAAALSAKLRTAPNEIVQGSPLTASQALTAAGAKDPRVSILESIVSQGNGGDRLMQRYADQAAARLRAMSDNGAQLGAGMASDDSERVGSMIGGVLRTQKNTERDALRSGWQRLDADANALNVSVPVPLDQLKAAMRPLGPGTVGAGSIAKGLFDEAGRIAPEIVEGGIAPLKVSAKPAGQNLEQAVRALGGIRDSGMLSGELKGLSNKQSGTTGLVNNKSGLHPEDMAQRMFGRGFIKSNDPAELFDALRNGAGRKVIANDVSDNSFTAAREAAMGDVPEAVKYRKPASFEDMQRLVRSATELARETVYPSEKAALQGMKSVLLQSVDDAAKFGHMTPELSNRYMGLRRDTAKFHDVYSRPNDPITSIVKADNMGNYSLNGSDITKKFWHGGTGLTDDISRLKQVLSKDNYDAVLNSLRGYVMTDAAARSTASGQLSSGFKNYVASRYPALQEVLTPEQFKAVKSVADDLANSTMSSEITGLKNSQTYMNAAKALQAGLLDAAPIKALTSMKGLSYIRGAAADAAIKSRGKTLSGLLSDPAAAADALAFESAQSLKYDPAAWGLLRFTPATASAISSR